MPRTTKSSLTDHTFPAFYACYLLKSIRTPRATATYIGSTPCPPRRIRQHNGEISQGAWKTKHNRPWVMQMIVHGFPSKSSALQFEWAWQHPHISRHLRDNDGNAVFDRSGKLKYLNTTVRVARSMVSSHPYNTWPLSVKFFTGEVEKAWDAAGRVSQMPTLPAGFKVTTELEGVDGKSGKTGTGRVGPIDVADGPFTAEHLHKASAVFSPGSALRCSICHEPVEQGADPLSTALCPASSCTAVSHLSCLSRHFLNGEAPSNEGIIPRGGICRMCNSYVLWGDVIRGCYRRRKCGVVPDVELEDAEGQDDDHGQLFGDDEDDDAEGPTNRPKSVAQTRSKKQTQAKTRATPARSKRAPYSTLAVHASTDEREHFDLDAISSTSDESDSDDERPFWHPTVPMKTVVGSRPSSSKTTAIDALLRQGGLSSHAQEHHSGQQVSGTGGSGPRGPSHTVSHPKHLSMDQPIVHATAAAGLLSEGERFRGERPAQSAHHGQMSRKPRSADTQRAHAADPPGSNRSVRVPIHRNSCPPPDINDVLHHRRREEQSGSFKPLEVARAALGKSSSLRSFPDIPPLSQPQKSILALDNEVLEISD